MKILTYADQSGKGECPPTPRRIRRLCERLLAEDLRWFRAPTRTIADQLIIARTETGEVIGRYSEGVTL